ncbi:MAG: hypothetical protein KBA72_16130 [Thermoanaerobaculia bacterium]|nr:hypothetical protein [Thermoanaerobaculia bacterium]
MTAMRTRSLAVTTLALVSFVPLAFTMGCNKPAGNAPAAEAAATAPGTPAEKKLPGAETPEALVERMKAGAAKEDFAEIAACLTPKNRTEMAMAMYMGATMMVAFADMGAEMGGAMAEGMAGMAGEPSAEDKKKMEEQKAKAKADIAGLKTAYNNLVTKYGLPAMPKEGEPEKPEPTQAEVEKLFASIDQGAFLNDALAVMKAMPGEHKDESGPVKIPEGGLENLKIEGDKATGTVGGDAFAFVKIDGRWYVEDLPKGASEEGAPVEGAPATTPGV